MSDFTKQLLDDAGIGLVEECLRRQKLSPVPSDETKMFLTSFTQLNEAIDYIELYVDRMRGNVVSRDNDGNIKRVKSPKGVPTSSPKHLKEFRDKMFMVGGLYSLVVAGKLGMKLNFRPEDGFYVETGYEKCPEAFTGRKVFKYLKNGKEDSLKYFLYNITHHKQQITQVERLVENFKRFAKQANLPVPEKLKVQMWHIADTGELDKIVLFDQETGKEVGQVRAADADE